jgi:hypothetical protein
MVDLRGGGETAEKHAARLFNQKRINGVGCSIRELGSSYWGTPISAGHFGIGSGGNPKFGVVPADINIGDWLAIQGDTRQGSLEKFKRGAYDETVQKAKESVENGNRGSIPTPVLEIRYDEYRVTAQEGRSRAIGARLGGDSTMPIWVAAREYR